MKLPDWATDPNLSEEERKREMLAYRLRAAAAFHDRSGNLKLLSKAAGYCGDYLAITIKRGKLPLRAELAVRQLVGADVFPTEEELLATVN